MSEKNPTGRDDQRLFQAGAVTDRTVYSLERKDAAGTEQRAAESTLAAGDRVATGRFEAAENSKESAVNADAGASATPGVERIEDEKGGARDDEIRELKQRLQEQEERWRQFSTLLSDAQRSNDPRDASQSTASAPRSLWPLGVLTLAVLLFAGAGILYFRVTPSPRGQAQSNLTLVGAQQPGAGTGTRAWTQGASVPNQQPPPSKDRATIPPPLSQSSAAPKSLTQTRALAPAETVAAAQPHSAAQDPEPASSVAPPAEEERPESESNPAPQPSSHSRVSRLVLSEKLSQDLSEYLHHHRLPFVDALVFTDRHGSARSVKLTGQVRTDHGRRDAEIKSKEFVASSDARVENHIDVNPALGATAPAPSAALNPPSAAPASPCAGSCGETQNYCKKTCQNQAAANVPTSAGSLFSLPQAALQAKQCNDDCDHAWSQCMYQCSAEGASEPSGGAPDQAPEGPDHPPE